MKQYIYVKIMLPQYEFPICNQIYGNIRYLGPVLQRDYELKIAKYCINSLALLVLLWSNQLTIQHISWQLSCRDMCKIVNWLSHY